MFERVILSDGVEDETAEVAVILALLSQNTIQENELMREFGLPPCACRGIAGVELLPVDFRTCRT
jgi:hypothetical protein